MALTTKPRPNTTHKKIKAGHHRQSKHYLKTYWPYIPIALILVSGFAVDSLWHHTQTTPPRLASYTYYDVLESSIGVLALAVFLLRHAFAWHKVWVKGETFAAKHPFFDIGLVSIATVGLILAHNGIVII